MATKPRKATTETWYDTFMEWSVDDQAIALKVLEQTHRQCVKMLARAASPKTDAVAGAAKNLQGSLLDGVATEPDNGGSLKNRFSNLPPGSEGNE